MKAKQSTSPANRSQCPMYVATGLTWLHASECNPDLPYWLRVEMAHACSALQSALHERLKQGERADALIGYEHLNPNIYPPERAETAWRANRFFA